MKKETSNTTSSRGQGTQGGNRAQHEKAGEAGGKAPHTCRGRQCSEQGESSSSSSKSERGTQGGSHQQHVKAGETGGKATHTCRGRQCSSEKE